MDSGHTWTLDIQCTWTLDMCSWGTCIFSQTLVQQPIPRILISFFGCLGMRRKALDSNVNNSVTLHYHTPFEVENVRYFVCVYVCEEK